MKSFLEERIELLRAIQRGDVEHAGYPEIALISCAILSSCAASRWPGTGIDKKRFIELLVSETADSLKADWVSIPTLINKGDIKIGETLYGTEGETRIFCGHEIDLPLAKAKERFPNVSLKTLKQQSYASLIYSNLRCGYSHEYMHSIGMTPFPPSRKNARISYIGRGAQKISCFHSSYLIELAEYHVQQFVAEPLNRPDGWWSDAS